MAAQISRRATAAALAIVMAAACAGPVSTPTASPRATPTVTPSELETPAPTTAATPTTSPTATALPTPADLSARPLIWYAPLPPMPGRTGSVDFMAQFTPDSPWQAASDYVDVYKLYGEWVAFHATDAQLQTAVQDIRRRGQILAVEAGPSEPRQDCSQGVESFAGIEQGRLIANRILAAGGRIAVMALDEPLYFGHLYDGQNACHLPIDEIAVGVANFVREMRTIFPELIVGDIESNTPPVTANGIADWLDAYRAAASEDFAFIQLDADWARPDWVDLSHAAQAAAAQRGVAFGMLYNGGQAPTRAQWVQLTGERIHQFDAGGAADHTVLQSWMPQPDHTLPESDPTTFAGLVKQYVEDYDGMGFVTNGPGANIALGRKAKASASLDGAGPGKALDGDYDVIWNAGGPPTQWIEITFDAPTDVASIRLTVAQSPAGPTVHRVLGRKPNGDLELLHSFDGSTEDTQILEYAPPSAWQGLSGIRIETKESPSWVAWREIEVFAP